MFTGLVEAMGQVVCVQKTGQSVKLLVRANELKSNINELKANIAIGDSIAVNGACLTVTKIRNDGVLSLDITPETYSRINTQALATGHKVNLERALSMQSLLAGHIVTGHIDGTAYLKSLVITGNSIVMEFSTQHDLLSLMVEKGSVAVDGVSLTIASIGDSSFSVALIPHTIANTTLQFLKEKDKVNIECDIIAKYVKKFTVNT